METKELSTTALALTALALGAAIGGGTVYALDPDTDTLRPVEIVAEVEPSALLVAAEQVDSKCAAEIRLAESQDCWHGCTTILGDKEATGWCCGLAFMPVWIQKCLDQAQELARVVPEPEPTPEPEPEPEPEPIGEVMPEK